MQLISTIQLGKKGLTENFIETLRNHFKTHQNVKVVVLRNARQSKNDVKKIAENIVTELGRNYTYRVLGFTIFIKKWRKPVRKDL